MRHAVISPIKFRVVRDDSAKSGTFVMIWTEFGLISSHYSEEEAIQKDWRSISMF